MKSPPLKVGLVSLGCAKNLVDSEIMLGSLAQEGIEITNDADLADVVIINTCSFINSAQEESVDTILEFAEGRDKNLGSQGIVVSGCLPQRFREELPKLIPEVDAFMGIDQVSNVSEIVREAFQRRAQRLGEGWNNLQNRKKQRVISRLEEIDRGLKDKPKSTLTGQPPKERPSEETAGRQLIDISRRPNYIPDVSTPRFRLTPSHFAYVKIADGCNHPCSFCIIPRMRGSHRSRAQSDIVREARQLVEEGVKELNLISQDSTYYGLDLRPTRKGSIASPDRFDEATRSLPEGATTLCTLLRELNEIPGDFWVRLLYTHPAHWTDDLIRTIAESPKVVRYVDMPLQHIHEVMLERMRRETSRRYIEDLIGRIRDGIPGIALRTTFIVGFPGETETMFESLLDFMKTIRFERLGVFTYSKEEQTRAGAMARQIPEKVKQERRERAMSVQQDIARALSASQVGREMRVLLDREARGKDLRQADIHSWEHGLIRGQDRALGKLRGSYWVARGAGDAPDIDGRVYVRGDMKGGEFARVKIVGNTDYDLIADPI